MHWLLRSGSTNERAFRSFLDDLSEGAEFSIAQERLLALGDLDAEVREHVAELQARQ